MSKNQGKNHGDLRNKKDTTFIDLKVGGRRIMIEKDGNCFLQLLERRRDVVKAQCRDSMLHDPFSFCNSFGASQRIPMILSKIILMLNTNK